MNHLSHILTTGQLTKMIIKQKKHKLCKINSALGYSTKFQLKKSYVVEQAAKTIMNDELMFLKKVDVVILKLLYRYSRREAEETRENLNQDSNSDTSRIKICR
jgi:hypothetical protein